jgi:glycosyltransferase involved in cell wall biosynthesis
MVIEVSIVIPTLNRLDDLERCIAALERQALPKSRFEIVVVDNGSTDGTIGFLKGKARAGVLRFLEQDKPGASSARNLGVRSSSARFIAFTDDDCIPEPDWLSTLLAGFPEGGRCAGVGGPILPQNPENVISRYWASCRVWDNMGRDGRAVHIPTMNVLYLRSVLIEVGIFDETVVGIEDIHLSQKIIKRKYELRYLKGGTVRHKDPTDVRSIYRKCWLSGRGTAAVARLYGLRQDKNYSLNLPSLIGNLVFRKKILEKFSKQGRLPLYDAIVYEFLHRVSILAAHNGFAYEMRMADERGKKESDGS